MTPPTTEAPPARIGKYLRGCGRRRRRSFGILPRKQRSTEPGRGYCMSSRVSHKLWRARFVVAPSQDADRQG